MTASNPTYSLERAAITGNIGYHTEFSNHPWWEHNPFDNHAQHSQSNETGSLGAGSFTAYRMDWSGHQHHPANGYDGEKGDKFPAPKGARDIYTYDIKGAANKITIVRPTDNRSTWDRITGRFSQARSDIADNFERTRGDIDGTKNPGLGFWDDVLNRAGGYSSRAGSVIAGLGTVAGMDDIAEATGYAIDEGTLRGIGRLSPDDKMAAIDKLAGLGKFEYDAGREYRNFTRDFKENDPANYARAGAIVNIAGAYGALAGGKSVIDDAGKSFGGRAAVGSDFAEAVAGRAAQQAGGTSSFNTTINVDADLAYNNIRNSTVDVGKIAENTGIKPENIQKVKDHVFYNEHTLDRYVNLGIEPEVRRFDSNIDQANAWNRLEKGTHTKEDIEWLKHETAERWYEKKHNSGYSEAHDAAEKKWPGSPWKK